VVVWVCEVGTQPCSPTCETEREVAFVVHHLIRAVSKKETDRRGEEKTEKYRFH